MVDYQNENFWKNLRAVPVANLAKTEPIDLSVGITANISDGDFEAFQNLIESQLSHKEATAIGGYLEKRAVYNTEDYVFSERERRNIHLGIDIWLPEYSVIFAPIQGKIHSFSFNPAKGQYGGCIILEHGSEDYLFYTLYGHLSKQSVLEISEGMVIPQGSPVGSLGVIAENGYWLPHLHFQIILDLQGHKGDYYGVGPESELAFYSRNCPDPNWLLQLQ